MDHRKPPTILLRSGLTREASAINGIAETHGWAVVRRLPVDPAVAIERLAFYGDTYSGPSLVAEKRYELIEPSFDLVTQLAREHVSRDMSFGILGDLVREHGSGFFKPADACAKLFPSGVYESAEAAALGVGKYSRCLALWSEPVGWRAEFRAIAHRGKLLSIACYKLNGRRGADPLSASECDSALLADAAAFATRLLDDRRCELPPACTIDVGLMAERGWGVIEFNPLWCSRFFGAAMPSYLDALTDVIWQFGAVPEASRRWSLRAQAEGSC